MLRKDSLFIKMLSSGKFEIPAVFFIALFLMISGIWAYPITILDEAKNAGAAREMFQGDHVFPTFNGNLRTDKPPMHYFFMQLGYALFGVNEFGARFIGSLFGAGFMTWFYIFLRRNSTINMARVSTFILLSSFFWIQEFHLAVPDPYLLTFLCSAWLFFYAYWKTNDEFARLSHSEPNSGSSERLYSSKNQFYYPTLKGLIDFFHSLQGLGIEKNQNSVQLIIIPTSLDNRQDNKEKNTRSFMQNWFSSKNLFFSPTLKGVIDFFHPIQGWGFEKNQNSVQQIDISTSLDNGQGNNTKNARSVMQNGFSSKNQFSSATLKGAIDFFHSLQGWGIEKNQNLVYRPKQTFLWLFYIFTGLATLSKGPVAIALTGLICLIFLILKKEFTWKKIWKYRPVWGGFLVLLISAPWFLWMHFRTDGLFTEGFFVEHNLNRFGSEKEGHGGIFLITWAWVIVGLFPFGAFIPQGLWHGWKFFRRNDLTAFSFVISVIVILFFSLSATRLPNYTLPAMPFLAVLVAGFFEEVITFKSLKKWWNTVSLAVISLITAAVPVAVFVLYEHRLINSYQFPFTLLSTAIVGTGLFFIWKYYASEDIRKWLHSIGLLWMALGLFIFYFIYPNLAKTEPVVQAAEIIQNNEIAVFESYDPASVSYTHLTLPTICSV